MAFEIFKRNATVTSHRIRTLFLVGRNTNMTGNPKKSDLGYSLDRMKGVKRMKDDNWRFVCDILKGCESRFAICDNDAFLTFGKELRESQINSQDFYSENWILMMDQIG